MTVQFNFKTKFTHPHFIENLYHMLYSVGHTRIVLGTLNHHLFFILPNILFCVPLKKKSHIGFGTT